MEIIAINGSPRNNGNTATMCKYFLEGASSVGESVNVSIINLYDLNYTGCISCFACKRIKGNTYGKCVVKDDIYGLLREVTMADALVIATPIYLGDITGQMRCFLERLIYPLYTYESGFKSIAPKRMPVVMIYTMNRTEQVMKVMYENHLASTEWFIGHVFSPPQRICAFNTYQFKNYNNYKVETFSESEKAEYRKNQFPVDCQNAFNTGKNIVERLK